MEVRFLNPVVFVNDIEVSKRFYTEVLELQILEDHKVFILFERHFSIHQADELLKTVFEEEAEPTSQLQGKNNLLLYFETDDLRGVFAKIRDQVRLIHPIRQQSWGQKVFRFYDPDGHIIEIGEPLGR